MKHFLLLWTILFCLPTNAQDNELSSASEFIDRSTFVQINIDENEKATFKSGLGEIVEFYPAEIIDLKQNTSMFGLSVESHYIISSQGFNTVSAVEIAWVGIEEIGDLIFWLENYVVPNLKADAGRKKTVKYIFNCKELTIKFEIYGKRQVFSVLLNHSFYKDKYFWTEAKVDDIPRVVEILKYLKTKQ